MRFLFLAALLLALIQPLESDKSLGSLGTPDSKNDLDVLSLNELNTKLNEAQAITLEWEKKVNSTKQELKKKEDNADKLNREYEDKKKDWKRLDKEDKEKNKGWYEAEEQSKTAKLEFLAAKQKLSQTSRALKIAKKNLTNIEEGVRKAGDVIFEINNREMLLNSAKLNLTAFEQAKPDPNDLPALEQAVATSEIAQEMAKTQQEIEAANRAHKIASEKLEKLEKDLTNYQPEHERMEGVIKQMQKDVDSIPTDLREASEKMTVLTRAQPDCKKTFDVAQGANTSATTTFNEKKAASENAETTLANTPLDTVAQNAATEAKLILGKANETMLKANEEVEKSNTTLAGLQENLDKANLQVAALSKRVEEKRRGTLGAGFKWWIILIVLAILAIVALVIFIVCCMRKRARKRPEENVSRNTTGTPKFNSNSSLPSYGNTPVVATHSVSVEKKPVDNKARARSDEASANETRTDKEVDPFNMPPGTSDEIVEKLRERAVKGTTAIIKANGDIHYKDVCGLDGVRQANGEWKVNVQSKDIRDCGIGVMQREYPADHEGIYERNNKPSKPIGEPKYDVTQIKMFKFGKNTEIVQKMPRQKSTSKNRRQCTSKAREYSDRTETSIMGNTLQCQFTKRDHTYYLQEIDVNISDISKYEYMDNRYDFDYRFVMWVLNAVYPILMKEKPLIEMPHPVVIVGDIHGQYANLMRMFSTYDHEGRPGWTQQRFLFCGDYVDRGPQSLETIVFLFLLKIKNPYSIRMLRGNHETKSINRKNGFYDELHNRFDEDKANALFNRFNEVFAALSYGCIISDSILCVHGGISPKLLSRGSFDTIKKPVTDPEDNELVKDIMWADPCDLSDGFLFNKNRGISWLFGYNQFMDVLRNLKVYCLNRGHQMMSNGRWNLYGPLLTTNFLYRDPNRLNYIAVTEVTPEGNLVPRYLDIEDNQNATENCSAGGTTEYSLFPTVYDSNAVMNGDYHRNNQGTGKVMPTAESDVTRAAV